MYTGNYVFLNDEDIVIDNISFTSRDPGENAIGYLTKLQRKNKYGTSTPEMIIEIAKMIQLEEHIERKYQGRGYDPLMYLTEKEKQDFFNKLSKE